MVLKYFLHRYFEMLFFMLTFTQGIYLLISPILIIRFIWALTLASWEHCRQLIKIIWHKIFWLFCRAIIVAWQNCISIPDGLLLTRALMNSNLPFARCANPFLKIH